MMYPETSKSDVASVAKGILDSATESIKLREVPLAGGLSGAYALITDFATVQQRMDQEGDQYTASQLLHGMLDSRSVMKVFVKFRIYD